MDYFAFIELSKLNRAEDLTLRIVEGDVITPIIFVTEELVAFDGECGVIYRNDNEDLIFIPYTDILGDSELVLF